MVLPLSDAPNPRGLPWVTYSLIALNVAAYLLLTLPLSYQGIDTSDPVFQTYLRTLRETVPSGVSLESVLREVSAYDLFIFKHGFRPADPQALNLVTSIFLHAGFLHLFGNMLFLWIYGDNVEHRLGPWKYIAGYLLTGVAATLFYCIFAAGSAFPLIGASGAISGVLGFYFLWFPRNVVRLFVFLFPFFVDVVVVSARWVLGFYVVIDNLLPFLLVRTGAGGGVAHGAHIGGFFSGLIFAWLLDRREVKQRPREFRSPTATRPDMHVESVRAAIQNGMFEEAARMYFAIPPDETRRLLSPSDSLALADWLSAQDHSTAALAVYRRHLRDFPSGPGVSEAHLGAGLIQLDVLGQGAQAYQHFLAALDAEHSSETGERARAALQRIAALQKYRGPHLSH